MPNQKVGSVYEIALADVGYMLSDNPQRPVRRQTGVLDSQPPGSDAPLSERIGRYDFIGASDWTGGEGQDLADRPSSDATRYYYSEGIDPFTTPGQITCLPAMSEVATDNDASHVVVASDSAYVKTGTSELSELASTESVPSVFSTGLAGAIVDLTSDGTYWYATDGATIRRNNTDADPAADWSTEDVTIIEWCTDRIMGIDTVASPEELISFAPDGTGTVLTMTHGTAFSLRGLCGGDGFVWYGANTGVGGHVRYWQVDSSPTNTGIALTLPTDETVDNLFYYLGNVFVASLVADPSGVVFHKIYRCVPSDGLLTPQLVVDGIYSFGSFATPFAALDRFVAFGWPNMMRAVQGGIGVIDLETGGYARWFAAGPVGGGVFSKHTLGVVAWNGKFGFTVQDTGFFAPLADTDYVDGFLETSSADLATPTLKHLDEIAVSTRPLPSSGGDATVAVAYSIDDGANYTTLATYQGVGETRNSTELSTAVTFASLRLRVTLTATGDDSDKPIVTAFLAKTHATGIIDEILELPISCEDVIADVAGTTIQEDSGPGKGMARYRALQALMGTKVTFQDSDWKHTQTTTLCEVVGVESTQVNVFNQNRGMNDQTAHVAVVTLRRPYTA